MDVKTFETIIIFTDKLSETKYKDASYYYKNIIKELPGIDIKTELLGKRKLAYKTRNCDYGWYLMFKYKSTSDLIRTSLEPRLHSDDNVIKFLTVDTKEKYTPDEESEQPDRAHDRLVDVFDLIFGIKDEKGEN